jgi:hypothetical protein
MRRTALAALAALALGGLALVQPSSAQDDADEVRSTVDGTVEVEKGTQKQQDDWAAERAGLLARYESARANVDFLEQTITIEEKEVLALEDAIAELERRLSESDRLNAVLEDTLNAIVRDLEEWVDRDLPFLKQERELRLQRLKDEMAKPDVTGAEKLRRVLEALQVEANYGSTVEIHQDRIDVSGEDLSVDLLRFGRVSVFWRTPDGSRVGEFDRAGGQWVELPGKYTHSIGMAMEMASRIRPVEIISLPLGRIVP